MHTMWQDVRYSLRMLGKYPGFTAIAVLTLAMGIGANTAIFSILNAVLLQPLPYPELQRLMAIWGTDSVAGETHRAFSYPDADLRNQSHTLEAVAAFDDGTFTLTGSGEPYHVHVGIVSANLLWVLPVAPELGSGYAATDDKSGTRVVLLSHAIWKTRFGGAPGILGQSILLDGQKYSVAGIMPASFQFPLNSSPADMWTTMAVVAVSSDGNPPITTERGAHFLGAIVCGIFAAAGLILAVVGLYDVMFYTVAQRTHEMGVHVAIGARKQDILKLVLAQGVGLTLAGIVIRVLGSLALTRFIHSQLFGVAPTDPRTFVDVVIVLLGVTAAACYFPERQATHVDPMVALRYE